MTVGFFVAAAFLEIAGCLAFWSYFRRGVPVPFFRLTFRAVAAYTSQLSPLSGPGPCRRANTRYLAASPCWNTPQLEVRIADDRLSTLARPPFWVLFRFLSPFSG